MFYVEGTGVSDRGLTHIAFWVADLERSIAFYEAYAGMQVVHRRSEKKGARVAWVSDQTRPFVLVLVQSSRGWSHSLPGLSRFFHRRCPRFSHLGVACASREEVDRLAARAAKAGIIEEGPVELPPPVGYLALIRDPDGYTLELSVGQEVEGTVERSCDRVELSLA